MTRRLRVLALCCDGLPQRHFLTRLAADHELAGVVIHATPDAKGSLGARLRRLAHPLRLARHLAARRLVARHQRLIDPERRELLLIDGAAPALPGDVPVLRAGDVNAGEVVELTRSLRPEVVVVNGTNLLRAPMLALAAGIRLGFVNLHTGLSPYTRGGNCNLWALLEEHPEWVGVTVHRVDAGIDSGEIFTTAQTPLRAGDCFEAIDLRAFRQGFDLLLATLDRLAAGGARTVAQWEEGRLYLRRTGYVYAPWLHVRVHRLLAAGLIERYLARRDDVDRGVRTVELAP